MYINKFNEDREIEKREKIAEFTVIIFIATSVHTVWSCTLHTSTVQNTIWNQNVEFCNRNRSIFSSIFFFFVFGMYYISECYKGYCTCISSFAHNACQFYAMAEDSYSKLELSRSFFFSIWNNIQPTVFAIYLMSSTNVYMKYEFTAGAKVADPLYKKSKINSMLRIKINTSILSGKKTWKPKTWS